MLHITTQQAWDNAQQEGEYKAESLESQGFIHMSKKEQVLGTLNLWFKNENELLLLLVNPEKLRSKLIFENGVDPKGNISANSFPHLYGPLNIDAVEKVQKITREEGCLWEFVLE